MTESAEPSRRAAPQQGSNPNWPRRTTPRITARSLRAQASRH